MHQSLYKVQTKVKKDSVIPLYSRTAPSIISYVNGHQISLVAPRCILS